MKSSSSGAYGAYSDSALLDALRTDGEGAFAEIYNRYCYPLFSLAYRKLDDREVAEELVQDLFTYLWAQRGSSQVQQLDRYLFSAMKYRIINHLKVRKVQAAYELYCRLSPAQADVDTATEDALALHDLSAALRASVQQLPAKSREIFQLSRLEHFTVPEISVRVNLSEKSVEYHLTKSLKLLRGYLRDFLLIILPLFVFFH
ncbi:sigma-70 family RNA polymerase sigma factor [Hymenobacter nivis]|uniref:Sigma-70 family RNA polymerase sigma factor n=1 Tax=Hymenobacter nivis TaxID=1850093 RepID=A0A502GYQ4_9BACT|nr:sigma-70 family RNA polymerase sigma factor [Hymenobacter nivis]TPG67537.1 sigma-70 family RNA polymerase sigma factor [Hymenobacter nivis]